MTRQNQTRILKLCRLIRRVALKEYQTSSASHTLGTTRFQVMLPKCCKTFDSPYYIFKVPLHSFLIGFFYLTCLHAVICYQVFQSNIHDFHTIMWFQVFRSNTNNFHSVICFQEFLPSTNNFHTVKWFEGSHLIPIICKQINLAHRRELIRNYHFRLEWTWE